MAIALPEVAGHAVSSAEAERRDRAPRLLAGELPSARAPFDIGLCPLCLGAGELVTPEGVRAWCGACAGTGDAD